MLLSPRSLISLTLIGAIFAPAMICPGALAAPFFSRRPMGVEKKVQQAAEHDDDLKQEAEAEAKAKKAEEAKANGTDPNDEALDLGPSKGKDEANAAAKPDPQMEQAFDVVKEDKNKEIDRHTKLGDMFFGRHDYTNSLIEFEIVLKNDPENFKAHYMLGKILMGMADYSEALKEFDKMLRIRASTGDGHFMRAEALRMLSRHEEAKHEYLLAIKIDAGNALAHAYLAECYRMGGQPRQAVSECKLASKINRELVIPAFDTGTMLCLR